MTDRDASVAAVLDRLAAPATGAPDWPDVLRRAGTGRPAARLAALAATVAVVAASSALAASDDLRTLVGLSSPSSITLVADLGRGAHVRLEAPGLVLAHVRRRVIPRRLIPAGTGRPLGRYPVRWRLEGAAGRRLVLRLNGRVVARLCAPCHDGQAGRTVLTFPFAFALFNGRVQAWLGARHARVELKPR